jgi:hypothetical protein
MGLFLALKLGAGAAIVAVIALFVWDYRSTKAENETLRLDLAAEQEARRFSDEARKVAIAEGERQADRAATVKTRTITIRKRPDGKDPAAPIILDTISGLHADDGGIPPGSD